MHARLVETIADVASLHEHRPSQQVQAALVYEHMVRSGQILSRETWRWVCHVRRRSAHAFRWQQRAVQACQDSESVRAIRRWLLEAHKSEKASELSWTYYVRCALPWY